MKTSIIHILLAEFCLIFIPLAASGQARHPNMADIAGFEKFAAEYGMNRPATCPKGYDKYDVRFYHLDLNVEDHTTYLKGVVLIRSQVISSTLDTFTFELVPQMFINSLKVNGVNKTYIRTGDTVSIGLNPALPQFDMLDVQITYEGTAPVSGFYSGLSTAFHPVWQKNVTWSLSEPWMAKEWWPCKQDLRDKADSSWVFITTSSPCKAGSNGLLKAVVPLPSGKVRYEWKSAYPIAYYLISFAVSEYMDYTINAYPQGLPHSIPIQNFIFNDSACLQQYKQSIDETATFLELYSHLVGMYPFHQEKYGHCQAYLGGAMEHQTMTTTGDFNPFIVSHELFHQWFGNYVTCARWNDIWINEGFGTYGTYLVYQYNFTQQDADIFMDGAQQYVISEPGGSVYIPDNQVNDVGRIFDTRLSYYKGAAIIHMLRYEMNDDTLFFNTLRQFLESYRDSVATGEDFKEVAENVSGMNLGYFFDQWYYGEGYPIYYINYLQIDDTLYIRSIQNVSSSTPFFRMPVEYRLLYQGGDTVVRLEQNQAVEYYTIPVDHAVTGVELNPHFWSLLKIGGIAQGIEAIDSDDAFLFYPNPAQDMIRVEFYNAMEACGKIEITDLAGRIFRTCLVKETNILLPVGDLARGTYMLRLEQGIHKSYRLLVLN